MKCFAKENQLPSTGQPGEVFYVSATKATYFALADGAVVNLNDLLSGSVPHVRAVGPQGEVGAQGPQGDRGERGDRGEKGTPGETGPCGVKGDRGEKGDAGLHGKNGKAGIDGADGAPGAVGPQGPQGATGATGPQGSRGDVCIVGEGELQDALKAARQALIVQKAKWLAAIQDAHAENAQRQHRGLKAAVDTALRTVEHNAQ
jgi:hypothetical protein